MSFLQLRSKHNPTQLSVSPLVTTQAVTNITSTTGDGNGTVINAGGSAITARGFVYSNSVINPTLADGVDVEGGTSTGTFTSTIPGLSSSTTYYVRAYATNANGTGYGDTVVFTTDVGGAAVYNHTRMMMGMGL